MASLEELRNIDLFYLMRAPFYRPYAWNRNALEQIKSSGSLRQMTNRQLAEKISAYEAFTYHLEGDFDFDRAVGTKSVELAGTEIDMNYSGVFHYFPVDQLESFSFPDSPIHDVYKETNFSLLTNDMKDIKVAVNSYLVLGSYYGKRTFAYSAPSLIGTRFCFSSSVNSRDFVTKRTPSGISREKLAPRPGVTSIVRCVSCQCSNCLREM